MDRKKKQKKIYNNAKDGLPDKLSQSSIPEDKEKAEFQPGSFQKETEPLKKEKQQNRLEYGSGYSNNKDGLPDKLPQSSVTKDKEETEFQPVGFQKEAEPLKKKKQQNRLEYGSGYNNNKDGLPDKLSQSSVTKDKEETDFQPGSFQQEAEPLKKKKQQNRWQQDINYNNTQKPSDNLSGGFNLPLDKELLQPDDSGFMDIKSGVKTANSRIKKSRAMKYFREIQKETEKPDTDKFMQEQGTEKQEVPAKIYNAEKQQQFCEENLFTEENIVTGNGFYNDSNGTAHTQKDNYNSTDKKSSYRKKYVKKKYYQNYNNDNSKKKQGYGKTEDKNFGKNAGEETGQDRVNSGFSDKDNTFKEDRGCFAGSRKLEKLQKKSEKAGKRLEKAKQKLPKEKYYHWERVFNEETGKASYVLVAVETEKTYEKASVLKKSVNKLGTEGRNFIHGKIAETEKENAGVEAAHKTEQASEEFFGFVSGNFGKRGQRIRKKAARLEKKKIKADNLFLYQKYIEENPDIQKKAARKKLQKERIKRRYAKAFRNGQMAGSPEEAAVKTKNMAAAVARKLQEITRVNTAIAVTASVIFLLFIIVMFSFSSCGAMFADTFTMAMAGTYLSEPAEIDAAELYFTQLEMDLQERIDNIPDDYPGYDEYSYNLGEIRHDPFIFISYLSAVYTEFTAGSVAGETSSLFNSIYNLELEPVTETRTRINFIHYTDPVTGAVTAIPVETEYEVTVLKVTLSVTPLENIVAGRMDTGQEEAFDAYMETKGALQQFSTPLDMDWYSSISSYYGYRKDPVTGHKQLHRGIDISVPEGTAVYATHNGTVSASGYDSIYGSYIVITDSKGFTTKYACLGSVYVSVGQEVTDGTQVGTAGTAAESTESHLHLEMMYNGIYYNPVFYFESMV